MNTASGSYTAVYWGPDSGSHACTEQLPSLIIHTLKDSTPELSPDLREGQAKEQGQEMLAFGNPSWMMCLLTPYSAFPWKRVEAAIPEKEDAQVGPAASRKPALLYLTRLFYFHKDLQTF